MVTPLARTAAITMSMMTNFSSALHAAGGLVQQQDPRFHDHGHRDVEQLAHAFGQHASEAVAIVGETETRERLVRRCFRTIRRERRSGCQCFPPRTTTPNAASRLSRTVRLSNSCGIWNERQIPSWVIAARNELRDVAPRIADRSRIRLEIAGHHIDERGLSGAVATDEANHRIGLDADIDVVRRGHRAEAFGQTFGLQNRRHVKRPCPGDARSDHRPAGRNMMTSSIAIPSTICQVYGVY